MKSAIIGIAHYMSLKTGLGQGTIYGRGPYNFTPNQLIFLCQQLRETALVDGCLVEAGCASGDTTVFLNKYMDENGIEKPYFAIDTYAGFKEDDLKHELDFRGKKWADIALAFKINKKAWFDKAMEVSGVGRVTSIEADVKTFDFARLMPIAFCLLDVDLYVPTKAALPRIYDSLAPGGVLIVDDCMDQNRWDGAYQAFTEFVSDRDLKSRIVHKKLGVLRAPPDSR